MALDLRIPVSGGQRTRKPCRRKWKIGRGRFVFLGKAGKLQLQEQGAKNGRTEKYRNVKEYQRVGYSKCREDGAYRVGSTACKNKCVEDRRSVLKKGGQIF
jgi:hypothetical protein